jgi:hypothetical protein
LYLTMDDWPYCFELLSIFFRGGHKAFSLLVFTNMIIAYYLHLGDRLFCVYSRCQQLPKTLDNAGPELFAPP